MLRSLKNCIRINNQKYSTSAATVVKEHRKQRIPIITCKRTEFNLFSNEVTKNHCKFGSIRLASQGWKSRKAKNDCFILQPTVDEEQQFNNLKKIDCLSSMGIGNEIIKNLRNEFDIEYLTPIQEQSILKIMDLNHILIAAETGCGKTLSYLIPIVEQILQRKSTANTRDLNTPLALILTPGRELASQIAAVAEKLSKGSGIKVKSILGGNTKQKMLNPEFQEVDILVGTMGAISKLVTTGIYRMDKCATVVLDEADTLLDDSFSDKLAYFLRRFPFHKNHLQDMSGSQLILASATMPTNVNELLRKVVDTETIHEIVSPNLHKIMPHVQQKFLRMTKSDRPSVLVSTIKNDLKKKKPSIVFSNKSATSDFVSMFLNNNGINCINLNGDMLMKIRIGRFEQFQNGDVDVLSTTDVGSRGLDTMRARHVINFDFPLHISDYIHRCGRIGRFGNVNKCLVTNFISSQREVDVVQKIEHAARTDGLLPNVNANITNLIKKGIIKQLDEISEENVF